VKSGDLCRGIAPSFWGALFFSLCCISPPSPPLKFILAKITQYKSFDYLKKSWVPIIYPNALNSQKMVLFNVPLETIDPILASLFMLLTGLVLLGVGFIFFVLTYIMRKGATIVDKELASLVDKTFTGSGKDH